MMRLGEAIRQYREAHSMSITDFARLVGLSRPYVYMLEVNKNTNGGKPIVPSMATVMKVSKAINVPVTDLIEYQPAVESVRDNDDVLNQYNRLNDADKQVIRLMMDRLLQPATA